jgi:hypothetical protein
VKVPIEHKGRHGISREGYSFILLPGFSDGNSGDWIREMLSTFPQPKMNIY